MELKEFSSEQFENTIDPFEYAYQYNEDSFKLEKVLLHLSIQAKKNGITNFRNLYKAYVKGKKKTKNVVVGNVTEFTGQTDELLTGSWKADDAGISIFTENGFEEFACVHPITIKERLTNIDSGVEKLKISFSRAKRWRDIVVPKSLIASSNKIIDLSDMGIAVTSENSRLLVRYLHDLEQENYLEIPEKKCCSRLGWIDEEGFAPYCNELVYDGDSAMAGAFKSVTEKGDFKKWKDEIKKVCDYNFINKIVIGASFASPLVKITGINNFFLHLWADTETAKTVSIMCAASVWANPEVGKYIQTYNSTNVGKERFAELANNLPVFFDELQIVTDRKQFDREIYELCEGAGRLRGNKYGGTDRTSTWQNCFLSTGEKPITSENSAGGAVNRIIEIQCAEKLIPDGKNTCDIIKDNYGMAGKKFVNALSTETIKSIFLNNYKQFETNLKTEKQTSIGAIIMTAFNYASDLFFNGEMKLTVSEISTFLNDKATVSPHRKAHDYLLEFVSRNSNKFNSKNENSEIFGKIEDGIAYIIKSVFDKMCDEGGFNSVAFISWLKTNEKIKFGEKSTLTPRINGVKTRCIAVYIDNDEDMPF